MENRMKRCRIGEIIKLKRMLPNLPTDNLYKFIFVGCLFLIGIGIYFFSNIYISLFESYDTYKIESVKLDIDYNKLKLEYSKTEKLIESDGSDPYYIDKVIGRLDSIVASFKENESILNSNIENVERKMRHFNCALPYLIVLLLLLIGLSVFFGFKWYDRLQKYQDKIIKREANKI